MKRNYRDYRSIKIGDSDIASLILVGCSGHGLTSEILGFGIDGTYIAYIVDGNAEIGEHYHKTHTFTGWLKIYDDMGLTFDIDAKEIHVYRAGLQGCIIQAIR